jgi:hypothetical protein
MFYAKAIAVPGVFQARLAGAHCDIHRGYQPSGMGAEHGALPTWYWCSGVYGVQCNSLSAC